MQYIFYFLIFPGFLFVLTAGLFVSWTERKLTARLQWREGPPMLQPLYDLQKLFVKETLIPSNAYFSIFILMPLLAFSSMLLAGTWLGLVQFRLSGGFSGDLIALVYILTIPSLSVVFAGAASGNPLAALGSSREMKLVLAYELIFWISLAIPVIKTGGLLEMNNIIAYQSVNRPIIYSFSGLIGFILALVCIHAKMGKVPFDIAEAETEIAAGAYIDYSGFLLGMFKMTQMMALVVLPLLLLEVFWGGANLLKYPLVILLIILLENTNPRLKITQVMRLFWFYLLPAGVLGIILALNGL